MDEKDQYAVLNVAIGDIIKSRITSRSYRILARRGDGAIVEDTDGSGEQMPLLKLYARQFALVGTA